MDYVNHELKIKDSSLVKTVIRNAITKENKAELLRLLYVAMTRAQEKLIITGSVKEIEKESFFSSHIAYSVFLYG